MTGVHTSYIKEDGVNVSPWAKKLFSEFEKIYLDVRGKEQRVMADAIVKMLPFVPASHPDHQHWKIRRYNVNRFLRYLGSKKDIRVLDAGCGNGFLSKLISEKVKSVTALDVNLHELKQGARIFGNNNISWLCADILRDPLPEPFDIIVFCCSLQYFESLTELFTRCKAMLTRQGEIHIIDTPFYSTSELQAAKERSKQYYDEKGNSEMSAHYFHHTWDELKKFNPVFLYRPGWKNRLRSDSPFCWIKLT